MLQRSRTRWSAERCISWARPLASPSFNGAALVGVRRGGGSCYGGHLRAVLQRSSTRWSAERLWGRRGPRISLALQRSRTRWSAESHPTPTTMPLTIEASTEPHSLECGELLQPLQGLLHLLIASTEPHSLECGEQARALEASGPWMASTEPHSLECGEPESQERGTACSPGFNGAALVGVRRVPSCLHPAHC